MYSRARKTDVLESQKKKKKMWVVDELWKATDEKPLQR